MKSAFRVKARYGVLFHGTFNQHLRLIQAVSRILTHVGDSVSVFDNAQELLQIFVFIVVKQKRLYLFQTVLQDEQLESHVGL